MLPAVPLKLQPFRRHFTLQQALSLNAGPREKLAFARSSGSEVMGLMAPLRQLAPTADSLKAQVAGPSSSQPFSILTILYHVHEKKSNVFLTKK